MQKNRKLPIQKTQLEIYAERVIPTCQIIKFKYRQDLLELELQKEAEFPEVKNVLGDIFQAVKEKNYKKFLLSHKQLNQRIDEETLLQSIKYSIISKKEPLTKREAEVLTKLNQNKGLIELF